MEDWNLKWQDREKLYMDTLEAQRRYFESHNCEVCGRAGHLTTLVGGRIAVLCVSHLDEIHECLTRQDAWMWWLDAQAEYDVAIRSGCATSANKGRDKALQELYALTGQWVEEKKKEVFVPLPEFTQRTKEA